MTVSDRDLYRRKMQAQLDDWKADVRKLKARASGLSTDAQLELYRQIRELDGKIEMAEDKLAELGQSGEEAWESVKEGVESAWDSLKSAVSDAVSRIKDQ